MAPRRGADRGQRSAARYPVADLAHEDTTNGQSPKTGPQKGVSSPKALRSPGLKALRSPGIPDSARSGCPDLRRRNDGRKNHQALQRTLGYAGRYAGRNAPGNQRAPATETPVQGLGHFLPALKGDVTPEVMAWIDKRLEEFNAAKTAAVRTAPPWTATKPASFVPARTSPPHAGPGWLGPRGNRNGYFLRRRSARLIHGQGSAGVGGPSSRR